MHMFISFGYEYPTTPKCGAIVEQGEAEFV
jgi:hypothetical protein